MNAPALVSSIGADALSTPIASAQEKSTPVKPTMNMGMDRQTRRMQENMKEMQQQMK